jgi:hypothetical protein
VIYTPSLWVNLMVLVDFYTPWIAFESPIYTSYHKFLVDRLPEREEQPLIEIPASEASMENIIKLTKGFTWYNKLLDFSCYICFLDFITPSPDILLPRPLVIRGLLANSTALKTWSNVDWWDKNYPDEEVLCGTLSEVIEDCTIRKCLLLDLHRVLYAIVSKFDRSPSNSSASMQGHLYESSSLASLSIYQALLVSSTGLFSFSYLTPSFGFLIQTKYKSAHRPTSDTRSFMI